MGVIAGKDMDECEGVDTGGGVEPREGGDPKCAIGGDVAGRELPPGEASGAALSIGRREGPEASERGARVESCAADGRTRACIGARAGEVQRAGGRAVRADAGRRAFGERRRHHGASRHVAPVDADRRVVESGADAIAPSPAAGAQGAFRRVGTRPVGRAAA
jgi:hypothetical protein